MQARYSSRDGKLWNEFCEINVTEHCNLSCRSCSHLSPVITRTTVDPEDVRRDLTLLSRSYRTAGVKLLGGEPLLHPDLPAVADAVRASGITRRVYVVTNGTLLPRMGADFWRSVDEIWVSVYPGSELSAAARAEVRTRARESGVRMRYRTFSRFRESFAVHGTTDRELVARIYDTCRIAHDWRCHTVANGRFYKCPKAYFIEKVLGHGHGGASAAAGGSGIAISDAPGFQDRLREYLESSEPLDACYRCLGTAGRKFEHEQVARLDWLGPQERVTEDLVDMRLLRSDEFRSHLPRFARKVAERLASAD